ncbi:Golgi reassembly-stacking protein 2 [Entomortierella beljakovae]|nr:Golgi reassembly-stacking protein 2 [Entomortierella beljakovae]
MGNAASGDKGRHRYGYHVIRVKDNSPAAQSGLRPFFDYIMAVNGIRLNIEDTTLREQMEANQEKPVMLDVYSTREQALRKVELTPRKWGSGEDGDITPDSPAELAGLHAHSDYIIGTPLGIMRGERDLYELVECNIGEEIPLHVFNTDKNQVREVIIIPSEEWGGEGLLGCDVGYGYLHRLPKELNTQDDKISLEHRTEDKERIPEKQHSAEASHTQHQENCATNPDEKNGQDSSSHKETQIPIQQDQIPVEKSIDNQLKTTHVSMVEQSLTQSILASQGGGSHDKPKSGVAECLEESLEISKIDAPEIVPDDHSEDQFRGVSPDQAKDLLLTGAVNAPLAQMSQTQENFLPMPPTAQNIFVDGLDHPEINNTQIEAFNSVRDHTTTVEDSPSPPPKSPSGSEDLHQIDASEQISSETKVAPSRQPPLAIGARLKPGLHGRGARVTHDGFSTRGKISLQDAQAQAQQQSVEYRTEKDRIESSNLIEKSQPGLQEHSGQEMILGDTGKPQDVDSGVNEYVVEGMIRNMSLGSSIFPL